MTLDRPTLRPTLALPRHSLPDALAESLRQRILRGEFREGDQLVQETIAKEYDVSRMPVREALRQLEAAGLVVLKMHKGAVVKSIPVDQIAELFDLRVLLESDLLRHSLGKISKSDLAAAEVILNQLELAYHEQDVGKWGTLNWAFHRALYVPSGRVQTLALADAINVQTDRYIRLAMILTHSSAGAEIEHRELLNLCARGNVKSAVNFLKQHISETGRHLLEALAESRDRKKS
jgi:DNA-binding GntR family transcriptional regulator